MGEVMARAIRVVRLMVRCVAGARWWRIALIGSSRRAPLGEGASSAHGGQAQVGSGRVLTESLRTKGGLN